MRSEHIQKVEFIYLAPNKFKYMMKLLYSELYDDESNPLIR